MGVVGIHVGSSIRVILVEPGWVGMILSTGIVIIIITVGVSISIDIIVTIVPVSVVATILAHVVGVVWPGTFTTVVVITITAIIHPAIIIPAKTVSIIMSNTFLCGMILGFIVRCTIE